MIVKRFQLQSPITFYMLAFWSLIASWCIFQNFTPYIGFFVFFIGLATFVYFFKKEQHKFDATLYFILLVLSCFFLLRANSLLHLLNILTIVVLGSVLSINKTNAISLPFLLFSPLITLAYSLITKMKVQLPTEHVKKHYEKFASVNVARIVLSLGITVVLLLVVLPLLSSANPLFAKSLSAINDVLNLQKIIHFLFGDNVFEYVLRIVLAVIIFVCTANLATYAAADLSFPHKPEREPTQLLLIPKLVMIAVLLLFFVTQLQLYFADARTLVSLNYTNSRITNEVFGQLSVVSLILFMLVFYDRYKSKVAKINTYILLLEGLFLVGVAFKSDLDYSILWGFTHKRLYGFAVVAWTLSAYVLFAKKYIQEIGDSSFLKQILVVTGSLMVIINVLNFDYLIYHVNKSRTGQGTDYWYLTQLSSDANAWTDIYSHVDGIQSNDDKLVVLDILYNNVWQLERKYSHFDIRSFNLSEYLQYRGLPKNFSKEIQKKRNELEKLHPPSPDYYQRYYRSDF